MRITASSFAEPMPGPAALNDAEVDFQMIYVLQGTCTLDAGAHGVHPLQAGDCVYLPAGTCRDVLERSLDCELLELTSPAAS